MKRNLSVVVIVCLLLAACAHKSIYDTNIMVETKFIAVAQRYALWKMAAPPDVKARWVEQIDPLIKQGDFILDNFNEMLKSGQNATPLLAQLDILITQILIKIAEASREEVQQ